MLTATPNLLPRWHPGPWPLTSTLDLGMLPAAVRCARHYAGYMLTEWSHLAQLTYDTQLIVSELVTNAVCHGCGPVTVHLRADSHSLLTEVWDARPALPRPGLHQADAERGHGLHIVARLSRDWGYYRHDGGKTVWALIT